MPHFAPGLPDKKVTTPLPLVEKPTQWRFVLQHHPAARSGDHSDLRFLDPTTGIAHSWATKKELPAPGKAIQVFRQPDHEAGYLDFQAEIPSGYGATRPGEKVTKVKDHPIEVLRANADQVRFNAYEGHEAREYVLSHAKGSKAWHLVNVTKTRDQVDLPEGKPKYKETTPSKVDLSDDSKVLAAKLDGAHVLFDLQGTKRPRVYSYRRPIDSKVRDLIEHTHKLDIRGDRVPKVLGDTLLRGELYARGPGGKKPLPPETVGGMLNASVLKSRALQEEKGSLRPAIFDVVRYQGKDYADATYRQKLEVLREVHRVMPALELPDLAFTKEEKKALLGAIEKKEHPATAEGVVSWPLDQPGPPTKVKFKKDYDVLVAGGISRVVVKAGPPRQEMGSLSYSLTPGGKAVGSVGSGFTREQRKHIWANTPHYLGAVMKVEAQAQYPSGALGKPVFKGWHLDNDPEFLAKAASKNTHEKGLEPGDILVVSMVEGTAKNPVDKLFEAGTRAVQGGLTHAAIYVGNGHVVESRVGEGVTHKPFHEAMKGHSFVALRPRLHKNMRGQAAQFAKEQVGKGYDTTALVTTSVGALIPSPVAHYLDSTKLPADAKKWTCANLVSAAYTGARLAPFKSIVSPADFRASPALEHVKTVLKHDDRHEDMPYWGRNAGALKAAEVPLLSREKQTALKHVDRFFTTPPKDGKWEQFLAHVGRKSFVAALKGDPRADDKLRLHADMVNRLQTGKVLGTVAGSVGPYSIVRLRGGGLGCTCNDWRYAKSIAPVGARACKHIKTWEAKKG